MTVVAACQVRLSVEDHDGNRDRLDDAVRTAAAQGAELVVLPELAASGYAFRDAAEARAAAEPVDGASVSRWQELSAEHGLVVVGGFCELADDGSVCNSAALVERGAVRAVYRKAHLWDREKLLFTPGASRAPVVPTALGPIAVLICYDLEFPEFLRAATLAGARLVAAPTNWPLFPRPVGERPAEVVRVQAAASVNRVFVVAADRCGPERGVDWVGGSCVVGPSGYPVAGPALPGEPVVLVADVDLAEADDKSLGPRNDVLADRRLDLYG